MSSILIAGSNVQSGAYLLRIAVRKSCRVVFGRYGDGQQVPVRAGVYVYVGSAMGRNGPASLAPRLLRHASRSQGQPPHAIRADMLRHFERLGLGRLPRRPPRQKSLHWHVDYLLDLPEAALTHAIVLRCLQPLEELVADLLLADLQCLPLAPGLGASDAPGHSHLICGKEDRAWWLSLFRRTRTLCEEG
ncbi:MAG: DUF123 domain-containing protein [Chloroflexota bacterium]